MTSGAENLCYNLFYKSEFNI